MLIKRIIIRKYSMFDYFDEIIKPQTIIVGNPATGKTTIFSAINWCLTGKELFERYVKSTDRISTETSVELTISFKNKEYDIERKYSDELKSFCLYVDKTVASNEMSELLIKISSLLFLSMDFESNIDRFNKHINSYLMCHNNIDKGAIVKKTNIFASFNQKMKNDIVVYLEDNSIKVNDKIKNCGSGDIAYYLFSYQCAFAEQVYKNININPQFLIDNALSFFSKELVIATKKVLDNLNFIIAILHNVDENFENDYYKIIID